MDQFLPFRATDDKPCTLYVDLGYGDDDNDGLTPQTPLQTLNMAIMKVSFHVGYVSWYVYVFTTEKPPKGYMNRVYDVYEPLSINNKWVTFYFCNPNEIMDISGHDDYDRPGIRWNACTVSTTGAGSVVFDFANFSFYDNDSGGGIIAQSCTRLTFRNSTIGFDNCENCLNCKDMSFLRIDNTCSLFIDNCSGSPIYATRGGVILIAIKDEGTICVDTTGNQLISASNGGHVIMQRLDGTTGGRAVYISYGAIVSLGEVHVTKRSTGAAANTYYAMTGARVFVGTQANPGT